MIIRPVPLNPTSRMHAGVIRHMSGHYHVERPAVSYCQKPFIVNELHTTKLQQALCQTTADASRSRISFNCT